MARVAGFETVAGFGLWWPAEGCTGQQPVQGLSFIGCSKSVFYNLSFEGGSSQYDLEAYTFCSLN